MEKSAKLLVILVILLGSYNSSWAVEEVVAKTQKPKEVQEDIGAQTFQDESAAQVDGMEIKNPVEIIKERTRAKKAAVGTSIVAENEAKGINIDADEIEYQDATKEIEARGHVVVTAESDNVRITADKGTLNHDTNILKFYDNVVIYKDGAEIKGTYMVINLNEENVLMDEPIVTYGIFKVTSREGFAYANKIESINGQAEIAKKMDIMIATQGFGSNYDPTIVQPELATDEMKKKRAEPYRIHTKEIVIKSDKDHDTVTLKNAEIFYKTHKILKAPIIQIYTDKERSYIETNIIEVGGFNDFGTYIGPGFVTKGPFGSTIKLVPILAVSDGVGAGGLVKFRSKRNTAELGWNSASNNLVGRGKYAFNKDFRFEYSRHAYMDEGFHGYRRPGYSVQLVHKKIWDVPNLKANYTQQVSAGYIADYSKEHQEDMPSAGRFRWQGELAKDLFFIGNKEQEVFLNLSAITQASATLYTTGDTLGVFRVGPRIQSRVKNWGSRIHFALGGIHGESPYEFDSFRYGKLSVTIDQNYRFNRYLAVGYLGTFSPLKDNFEKKLVTENRFYVMAGPEDVKVAVFYDTERSMAAFDLMFLLGSSNLKTTYDKLTIENYEKIGKKREPFEDFKLGRIKIPQEESDSKTSRDKDADFIEYDPYKL